MHISIVTEGVPTLEAAGDHQTPWSITKAFLDNGHRVTSLIILNSDDPWRGDQEDRQLSDISKMGAEVVTVPFTPPQRKTWRNPIAAVERLFSPPLAYMFPQILLGPKIQKSIDQIKPDGLVAMYFGSVAATHSINSVPKMAALGSLPHSLPLLRRKIEPLPMSISNFRRALITRLDTISLKKMETRLLSNFGSVVNFAKDQTDELVRLGFKSALFLTNPTPDFGGDNWISRRASYSGKSKFKILLIGQMTATFTRYGLNLFADEILPILEERLGPDKVEVHVVGKFTPTDELVKKLDSPIVIFRGWVDAADPEYLSSDVVLIPNPVKMGERMKIIHGMSCGSCMVAHKANTDTAASLVDDENILVGKDGPELAEAIIRVFNEPGLRDRIGAGARRTYDHEYSPEITGRALITEIEKLVGAG